MLVILGHRFTAVRFTPERGKIHNGGRGYNYAAGMLTGTLGHTFEFHRNVDNLVNILFGIVSIGKFLGKIRVVLLVECILEFYTRSIRDHLCQLITEGIGEIKSSCNVLYGSLGGHRAEGNNLGHGFVAVGIRHMLNNFTASFHTHINIEIRH